jgi:predicted Zn finger-like uncharacterized protein
MSLYTRCPDCTTVFRVVADQLRISEGWVRCGQCAVVFQGNDHLWIPEVLPVVPSEPGGKLAAQEFAPASAGSMSEVSSEVMSAVPGSMESVHTPHLFMSDEVAMLASSARRVADDTAHVVRGREQQALHPNVAGAPSAEGVSDSGTDSALLTTPLLTANPRPFTGWDPHAVTNDASPAFVRRARRIAFWSSPRMRWVVGSAVMMALLVLFLQWAWFERDRLAARWPGLSPPLKALCSVMECELAAPRAIESLMLDSSSFLRVRGDVFRLTFSVRHSAQHAVKTPHVELTLTDMDDQPVYRTVWAPAAVSADAPPAIRVGESWSASTLLAVEAASRVAGYRLLTFYP